jgi:hypothetical protein
MNRRVFLRQTGLLVGASLASTLLLFAEAKKPSIRLSLAEWSLHRSLYAGKIQHLDFPRIAKEECDFDAIEHPFC